MTIHVLEHYTFEVPENILAIEDEKRRAEAIRELYETGQEGRFYERSYMLREEPTIGTTMRFVEL